MCEQEKSRHWKCSKYRKGKEQRNRNEKPKPRNSGRRRKEKDKRKKITTGYIPIRPLLSELWISIMFDIWYGLSVAYKFYCESSSTFSRYWYRTCIFITRQVIEPAKLWVVSKFESLRNSKLLKRIVENSIIEIIVTLFFGQHK